MDEPEHSKYRKITQSWFTHNAIKSLEERIRDIARDSIDRMAQYGSTCDFVQDVARAAAEHEKGDTQAELAIPRGMR
jgi:cytochrome P450